jgi:formylglycine-generating enzyme required for sulfatase activity
LPTALAVAAMTLLLAGIGIHWHYAAKTKGTDHELADVEQGGSDTPVPPAHIQPAIVTPMTTNAVQTPGQQTVDLLKLVDLARDTRSGSWTKSGSTLITTQTGTCELVFPCAVPQEYDYTIVFQHTGGGTPIGFMLTAGGRQFAFGVGNFDNKTAGFTTVDNHGLGDNGTTSTSTEWIKTGQPQKVLLRVRKNRTEAYLDNQLVSSVDTDIHDVGLPPGYSDMHANDTLGIRTPGDFVIESATITPLAAQAGLPSELPAGQLRQTMSIPLSNGINMDLVRIDPGSFSMGSDQNPIEMPVHKVNITKPFYMGTYPVTQEQWQAVMGNNPSQFKGVKNPVDSVSWSDCQEFVTKLNALVPNHAFSLPTEAQWEYACRAGTNTVYFFGNDAASLDDYAWVNGNSDRMSHPVGLKKPNPWGLYDMLGNVWQWCADYENYANGEQTDPSDTAVANNHIERGGSWASPNTNARVSSRLPHYPNQANSSYGFRLVCASAGADQDMQAKSAAPGGNSTANQPAAPRSDNQSDTIHGLAPAATSPNGQLAYGINDGSITAYINGKPLPASPGPVQVHSVTLFPGDRLVFRAIPRAARGFKAVGFAFNGTGDTPSFYSTTTDCTRQDVPDPQSTPIPTVFDSGQHPIKTTGVPGRLIQGSGDFKLDDHIQWLNSDANTDFCFIVPGAPRAPSPSSAGPPVTHTSP